MMGRRGRLLWRILLLLTFLLAVCWPTAAAAEKEDGEDVSIEDGVDAWLSKVELGGWQAVLDALPDATQSLWADADVWALVEQFALPTAAKDGGGLIDALLTYFVSQWKQDLPLLLALLGVAVISAFTETLAGKSEDALAVSGGFLCRCFALTVVLAALGGLVRLGAQSLGTLAAFMELSLPVLLTLMTGMGAVTVSGTFQPMTALLTGSVTAVMKNVVFPLSVLGGVIGMLDRLSGADRLQGLSATLKKAAKWTIGAMTTLYIGAITLFGLSGAAYDSVSLRTAKYAASSMVPFVGGMVSGSFDTVLGCAVLVKNAVGTAAVLLALSVLLYPLIRLFVFSAVLRVTHALSQPIADKRLCGIYDAAADTVQYVSAAILAVALMFVITVGLIMGLTRVMIGG